MAPESPRSSPAAEGSDTVSARSYLYVPGDQAGKLQRALVSGADAIIADLEDAVAPSAKANARRTVAEWLATQLDGDHSELWSGSMRLPDSSPTTCARPLGQP
jgi:hypothetical protein